jgi:hypothetical protein
MTGIVEALRDDYVRLRRRIELLSRAISAEPPDAGLLLPLAQFFRRSDEPHHEEMRSIPRWSAAARRNPRFFCA